MEYREPPAPRARAEHSGKIPEPARTFSSKPPQFFRSGLSFYAERRKQSVEPVLLSSEFAVFRTSGEYIVLPGERQWKSVQGGVAPAFRRARARGQIANLKVGATIDRQNGGDLHVPGLSAQDGAFGIFLRRSPPRLDDGVGRRVKPRRGEKPARNERRRKTDHLRDRRAQVRGRNRNSRFC